MLAISSFCQNANKSYDAGLATALNADDYGMKNYTLVILKTGTNTNTNKAYRDSCFAGHFSNMQHMTEIGKLVVAGPIGKNKMNYRGIFILNATDSSEVNKLLMADPTISEGILIAEPFPWYGSAALSSYLDEADKIWKTKP